MYSIHENELLNWLFFCLTVLVPIQCNHYIIFSVKLYILPFHYISSNITKSTILYMDASVSHFFYRNIRTVSIQIEITKYLYKCLTNPDPEVTMPTPVSDSKRPYLPTMFGNTKTRTDLVNMVHVFRLYQ